MRKNRIYLSPPHMGGNELKYIQDAFESNWIAPLGPQVDALEKQIEDFIGYGHCAVLSTGTAAIHLALILLSVQEGDYVICPSFTFSASANPILYQKAVPIFVDSELDTWNMDPIELKKAIEFGISKNKKPKAIILVHLYGMPCNISKLISIAKTYDIPVIEDAAESLGSKYQNVFTGTFGDFGILSFNGNKIITTSGGGAIISKNKAAIAKAKFLATQARDKADHYQHSEIGYNYRMSNICAAIGCGQMEILETRIQQRRNNYTIYASHLSNIPGIDFLKEPDGFYSNRWLTTIRINKNMTQKTPIDIFTYLEKENIESRPVWKPLHLQPVFAGFPSFLNGNSAAIFENGLCLPSGSALTENDIIEICNLIKVALSK